MSTFQIILLVPGWFLMTEATFFKKLITPVIHNEPQHLPLEPAPVFENTGEVIDPALLPPPSLYSIQPVHHYVSLVGFTPDVLPHSFYPFLQEGAYAQNSANAGGAFLYQPQTALDQQAAYIAAQSQRYAAASEEIHNQQLINAAREQAAYNSAAQANALANAQSQQFASQNQVGAPQRQNFNIRNFNSAQNNAAVQQQQFTPPNQYGVPIQAFNNAQSQNLNTAQSDAASNGLFDQRFGFPVINTAAQAQSSAAATASSGQNQQLFSPFSGVSTHSAASSSLAHSSSVVSKTPLSTSSASQSFASSSSAASSATSGNGITPYSLPSSSSSSNAASSASASAVNLADNFIVPSASYGPPQ